MNRQRIHFFVNGKAHQAEGELAFLSLSQYLRDHLRLVGTKIVCAEGDCGACSVLMGRVLPDGSRIQYRPVDSCIVLMPQVDGTHIVTVEGLREESGELSPVQKAMVDCHGSQCGFCTPGFVATITGLVEETPRSNGCIDRDTASLGLSGNLCRCTGYEQILEACDSINTCEVKRMSERYEETEILNGLKSSSSSEVSLSNHHKKLFIAKSVASALEFKREHQNARVISGCTDIGVQRTHGRFHDQVWLTISHVDDLRAVEEFDHDDRPSLRIGAATPWTDVLNELDERFIEFDPILKRFGSPQIRNIGSIGGNLVNASPIADSIPFLYVADAQLELSSTERGKRVVPIVDFYKGYKDVDLQPDELLTSIVLPLPQPADHFKLYKLSKRRDMDISTMTAAFRLTIQNDHIVDARVALGGVAATVLRMHQIEDLLTLQPFSEKTLAEAGERASEMIKPLTDVRGRADYRKTLARNIFIKCFHDLSEFPMGMPA
ncbi:MAG: FAD binding domain-containing protein [Planctomycetota bacterium]